MAIRKIPRRTPIPNGIKRQAPWISPGISRAFKESKKPLMVLMTA